MAVIKSDGRFSVAPFAEPRPQSPCSFERIYFSRGNDATIYENRKALGEMLVPQVLDAVGNDLENTVVSFVPNTAETAFYGFMDGLRKRRRVEVKAELIEMIARGRAVTRPSWTNSSCGTGRAPRRSRTRTSRAAPSSRRNRAATCWSPASTTSPTRW